MTFVPFVANDKAEALASFKVAPLATETVAVAPAAASVVVIVPVRDTVPPVILNVGLPLVGVAEWAVVRAMLPLKLRAVIDEFKVNV